MSILSEERTNVDLVDSSAVVSIDRSVSSVWGVVVLDLEFSLEGLKSSLEIDLLLDDSSKGKFDVSWEEVESSNMSGWSVEGSVSEVVVFAWQGNLEELLEGESLVSVAVEEQNQVGKFRVQDMVDSVISEEVGKLSG